MDKDIHMFYDIETGKMLAMGEKKDIDRLGADFMADFQYRSELQRQIKSRNDSINILGLK